MRGARRSGRFVFLSLVLFLSVPELVIAEPPMAPAADKTLAILLRDAGLTAVTIPLSRVQALSALEKGYQTFRYEWQHPVMGPISASIRGPQGFHRSKNKYRLLVTAAGFNTHGRAVELLGDFPETVIAAFDYPENEESLSKDPARVSRFVRFSAGQLAFVLLQLSREEWVNETVALGVSLGGIVLPSALRMAQFYQAPVSRSVFAYSGAQIGPVVRRFIPADWPDFLKEPLVLTAVNLTSFYDPMKHLPHLKGKFLVIRATREEVFPAESYLALESVLPEPKSIALVAGPHITESQKAMIQDTQRIILSWWLK